MKIHTPIKNWMWPRIMHTSICKHPTNDKSNNGWKNWWKKIISWKKLGIMDVNMEKWVDTFIYCVKF
jgi:hypothetical protein